MDRFSHFHQEPQYVPYSYAYTPGWRDHPNSSYGNLQYPSYDHDYQEFYLEPRPQGQSSTPSSSMEDMMKMLMQSNVNLNENVATMNANVAKLTQNQSQFQASIQNLERQFDQISQVLNKLEAKESITPRPHEDWSDDEEECCYRDDAPEMPVPPMNTLAAPDPLEAAYDEFVHLNSFPLVALQPDIHFPEALKDTQKVESDKGLFDTFSSCKATTPLVHLADSTPRSKEMLKVLGMIKKKPKGKHKKEALIQVVDLYMLDTGQDKHAAPEMLGRPFLRMTSAIIDVKSGPTISKCTSQGERLNMEHTKRHPPDINLRSSSDRSNPS